MAACGRPVISAVGHETDVTIADFVADVRAATPSAAAEIVSPDLVELSGRVDDAGRQLAEEIHGILSESRVRLRGLGERMSPRGLRRSVDADRARLQRMQEALAVLGPREILRHRDRLEALGHRLDLLSPLATLQRGYAIAEWEDGRVVAHAAEVDPGDALAVRFQDGRIHVRVNEGAT
ncbi:MAG TPA: exodeoxyribonuclease VII large subunit [Thermoanaerobaculia bacterium]